MSDFNGLGEDVAASAAETETPLHTEAGMGEDAALLLGDDAPESFVPDSPEGYEIPENWNHEDVPEEISRQVVALLESDKEDFKRFCHNVGMTEGQAGKAFDALGIIMAEHLAKASMADNEKVDAVLARLAPTNAEQYWNTAKRGARYLGIGKEIDAAGLTANPLVLQLVHTIGDLTGEDRMRGAARAPRALPSGDAARQELYKIVSSDAYKKNDPATMQLAERLAARVTR